MPRETHSINISESLIECEDDLILAFSAGDDVDAEDDSLWQEGFSAIGVDPFGLPELKLTRQHGRLYDEPDEPVVAIDL